MINNLSTISKIAITKKVLYGVKVYFVKLVK